MDLSSDTTFSFTSFSDQYHESKTTLDTRKYPLSTSNISLAKSILVLNSVTIPKSNIFLTA